MNTQTILLTALPNGRGDGNVLKLSVFVSFRLSSASTGQLTLNDYSDVLGWTTAVRDSLRLEVHFENGPTIPLNDPTLWNGLLNPDYWQAMFTLDSPVTPYEVEPLDKVPILSYPVMSLEQYIKQRYVNIAEGWATSFPPAQTVKDAFKDASLYDFQEVTAQHTETTGRVQTAGAKTRQQVQPMLRHFNARTQARVERNLQALLKSPGMELKQGAVTALQGILNDLGTYRCLEMKSGDISRGFLAFDLFHTPMQAAAKNSTINPQNIFHQFPQMEFHEAVSSLGDYPGFMRKVGLVVDLVLPWQSGIPASSFVQVKANWKSVFNSSKTINFSPKTRYSLTGSDFYAPSGPGGADIQNGLFNLSNTQDFDIVQLDVDGAAMKIRSLLATLEQQDPGESVRETIPQPPLLLADAGGQYKLGMIAQLSATAHLPVISLPALRTQGISIVRVDRAKKVVSMIDTQAKDNVSLVYAQAHPTLLLNPNAPSTEVDKTEVRLYAEDLVRGYRIDVWDETTNSWRSLCKRKSTLSFTRNAALSYLEGVEGSVGMAMTSPPAEDGGNESPDELRLSEYICRWDGWSLVAPRPGKRISDLDQVEENANPSSTFTGLASTTEAESNSLPRLRFGRNYRLRARTADLAGNGRDLQAVSAGDFSTATRIITFLRMEPAGSPALVLRTPDKPGESVERMILRSNFDQDVEEYLKAHSLHDPVPERHFLAPRGSELMAEYHGKFDGMTAADAYALITSRDSAPEKIYPGDTVDLPYLPDPYARGVSLSFSWNDNPIGTLQLLDFSTNGKSWPNAQSFRIQVAETGGAAEVEKASDTLIVVKLPKAGVVKVRYSSYLDEAGAKLIGFAGWAAENAPAEAEKIRSAAKQGLHWMVTPSRELLIVHAVQQPLAEPVVKKLVPLKTLGATFALLNGTVALHGASTGRLDFRAEWSEPLDDITQPEWAMMDGKADPISLTVGDRDEEVHFGDQDAKPQSTGTELQRLGFPGQVTAEQGVAGKQAGKAGAGPQASVFPAQRHDFGDTKYRKVRYTGVAITRFRECFLDLLTPSPGSKATPSLPLTREGPLEVEVLNSGRPNAPLVSHIVPTSQWERKEDDTSIISRRCGGGFRVFLERPWFSSGEGELLGVVVNPGGKPLDESIDDDNRLIPFVTQWGLDPARRSSGLVKPVPTLADFKDTARTQTNVFLEELPLPVGTANIGGMVPLNVAGYKPKFDKSRNLWFADVVVDPGEAYFPFVRLALVRYQPKSIMKAHLSRVVLSDFIQVLPDRVSAVTCESEKKLVVQVAGVFGTRFSGDVQPLTVLNRSTYFTATLERRVSPGDFGWLPESVTGLNLSTGEPSEADRMVPTQLHGTKMRWVKELVPTEPVKKGTKDHRVVIREYELYLDAEGNSVPRMVFADVIEI
jgi:hypothetical protein